MSKKINQINTPQTGTQSEKVQDKNRPIKPPKSIPIYKKMLSLITSTTNVGNNKIKTYFQEAVVDANTDILAYWKENSLRFPILSEMGKDYISMMPTSVASERAFS